MVAATITRARTTNRWPRLYRRSRCFPASPRDSVHGTFGRCGSTGQRYRALSRPGRQRRAGLMPRATSLVLARRPGRTRKGTAAKPVAGSFHQRHCPGMRAIAITGANDRNTIPYLAEEYVQAATSAGILPRPLILIVPGAAHDFAGALRSGRQSRGDAGDCSIEPRLGADFSDRSGPDATASRGRRRSIRRLSCTSFRRTYRGRRAIDMAVTRKIDRNDFPRSG